MDKIDYRERFKTFLIAIDFFKEQFVDKVLDEYSLKDLQYHGAMISDHIMDSMIEEDDDEDDCHPHLFDEDDCQGCPKFDKCKPKDETPVVVVDKKPNDHSEKFLNDVMSKLDPKHDGKA